MFAQLTYRQIADFFGFTLSGAKQLVRRRGWGKITNHPKQIAVFSIPKEQLEEEKRRVTKRNFPQDETVSDSVEARSQIRTQDGPQDKLHNFSKSPQVRTQGLSQDGLDFLIKKHTEEVRNYQDQLQQAQERQAKITESFRMDIEALKNERQAIYDDLKLSQAQLLKEREQALDLDKNLAILKVEAGQKEKVLSQKVSNLQGEQDNLKKQLTWANRSWWRKLISAPPKPEDKN